MTDQQQPGDVLVEAAKLLDAVRRRVGEAARAATSGPLWDDDEDQDVWAKATKPEPKAPGPRSGADEDVWAKATGPEPEPGPGTPGPRPGDDRDVWARAVEEAQERAKSQDPGKTRDHGRAQDHGTVQDHGTTRDHGTARDRGEARERGRAQDRGKAREDGKTKAGEDVWAHVLAEEPHIATGAPECRNCPVCRAIALARESGPDVRRHVEQAGRSLMEAALDVVAAFERTRSGRAGWPGGAGASARSGRDAADVG